MATIGYPLIDEASYEGDFLFLYKEANISEDRNCPNSDGVQWLRDYITDSSKDQKAKTSATKLLRQVFIAKEIIINRNSNLEDIVAKARIFTDKKLLATIGFLNIVKEGGGKTSDNSFVLKYLEDHSNEIAEEVKSFKCKGKDLNVFVPLGYSRSLHSTNIELERVKKSLALSSGFLLIAIPHYARASYLSVTEAIIKAGKG